MSQASLSESLANDKNFVRKQLRCIPKKFWSFLSKDEIESELYFTILNCSKKYNPKLGHIFGFVKWAFINNLNNLLRNRSFEMEMEAPLEAAYNKTYVTPDPSYEELLSYLRTLPEELLTDLTEFVLGQKNKEEIISNPSFQKINIDRILEKLDGLVV